MSSDTTLQKIKERLRKVTYPGLSRNILSFGFVKDIQVNNGSAKITLAPSTRREKAVKKIIEETQRKVARLDEIDDVSVQVHKEASREQDPSTGSTFRTGPVSHKSPSGEAESDSSRKSISGVDRPLVVASGKGGVGKSTVAVNLAAALKELEGSVGLLDLDFYGPDVPTLFNLEDRPDLTDQGRIEPVNRDGLKVLSAGLMLSDDTEPMLWRAARVAKLMKQFLWNTRWGELNSLVIDLPPGTGDPQLSLVQDLDVAGGLVVTTAQDMTLKDAVKSVQALRESEVPVLGLVENMGTRQCPHCGGSVDVFGNGGTETIANQFDLPFQYSLPFDPSIRKAGNRGKTVVSMEGAGQTADLFRTLGQKVLNVLE